MRKVVLIGRGRWGKILLPHLEKKFEVMGVFGREFRIDSDIDAVIVATPIGTHYPIVLEALQKGKHVFCEKPLTVDPDKAKELIELSKAQGVQLVTDYTYTFSERLRSVREEIGYNGLQSASLVLKRDVPDGKGSPYWVLASHLISILGMFTDLARLKFVVTERSPKAIWISFKGGAKGDIIVDMQAERETLVLLEAASHNRVFTRTADDDNIGYALSHFEDAMNGKARNHHNLDLAYSVTKVIHDLEAV